ncbi:1-Cys peroxiredoxin PER1 [Panicum miliaceum]|uniref:thioredoxin-dependent peroxiredoxin n=1 Tax=Panicum miliaceum TaxID=4540 RepID=A0A3L6TVE3_PANMI|nr:1-Cys peroxiredoxin PER1 [Panicum miliaceum]
MVKLSFLYSACTGRNMDEVLRAVDSLLTAARHKGKVATPANWKPEDRAVIGPSVANEEARKVFTDGFETPPRVHAPVPLLPSLGAATEAPGRRRPFTAAAALATR